MKTFAIAGLSALALLVPEPLAAQEIQVFTDKQGLQTYTNVPASQRKDTLRVKEEGGVKVYSNLLPRRKSKSSHQAEPVAPAPVSEPEVPEPALQQDQVQDLTPPAETPAANGQWVNTSQDGWLYMPYGDQYVSEGSPGDESPYAYVYEPDSGWTWLEAPWVWGWGPYPYFGALGPGASGGIRGSCTPVTVGAATGVAAQVAPGSHAEVVATEGAMASGVATAAVTVAPSAAASDWAAAVCGPPLSVHTAGLSRERLQRRPRRGSRRRTRRGSRRRTRRWRCPRRTSLIQPTPGAEDEIGV